MVGCNDFILDSKPNTPYDPRNGPPSLEETPKPDIPADPSGWWRVDSKVEIWMFAEMFTITTDSDTLGLTGNLAYTSGSIKFEDNHNFYNYTFTQDTLYVTSKAGHVTRLIRPSDFGDK